MSTLDPNDKRYKLLEAVMRRHGYQSNALIEVLHTAQQSYGFLDAAVLDRSSIALAAFSQGIAVAAGRGWRAIAVAERPEDQALLSAAHTLVRIAS